MLILLCLIFPGPKLVESWSGCPTLPENYTSRIETIKKEDCRRQIEDSDVISCDSSISCDNDKMVIELTADPHNNVQIASLSDVLLNEEIESTTTSNQK